jgi:hypothetical protein
MMTKNLYRRGLGPDWWHQIRHRLDTSQAAALICSLAPGLADRHDLKP